jgi:apolipoprotein N-acyltransferase
MKEKNNWIREIIIDLILILAASVLFTLSFPNPVIEKGFPLLAWFAYIPILLVIKKSSLVSCIGWGAVYGFFSYFLLNYWLMTFHPAAGTVVYSIYLFYMAVVFPLLKLAVLFYPKQHYLVQWTIWLAYEYLRTLGFLGYPYGITGYSQWRIIPLIQIASITGIWGVSALVTFPSFLLAGSFKELSPKYNASLKKYLRKITDVTFVFLRSNKIPVFLWVISITAAFIFGIMKNSDFSFLPAAQIALIQHNTDPWNAANAPSSWQKHEAYKNDLTILKNLSDIALSSEPKPQLVVWPETAFIPRIHWHTTYRDDQDSWTIVKDLLDYLSTKDTPFLIGNDDARMEPAKNPNEYEKYRVDYNAVLLFENGQLLKTYRKLHLVPFTEHFPYEKLLPWFYRALQKTETHFWESGEEETLFTIQGFSFSTPICFEDSFGYLSRNFVRNGADILINLTNDAWAKSLSSQNQHLSMAIFRAVENCRPMVRSTVSGQTCSIDPMGRVTAIAPAFTEAWINVNIPLIKKNTIYTMYGDYLGIAFLITALILLLYGAVWYTIKKIRRGYWQ